MSHNTWTPGRMVWRELLVADVDRAKGHYGERFGWKFEGMGPGGDHYTVIQLGSQKLGGIMRPPMAEIPPSWMSYVSVEDVDEVARLAAAKGGKVLLPPTDQQGVGRFAVIADPGGAAINVIRFSDGDPDAEARPPSGAFCWETLLAADVEREKAFYSAVLGWKVASGPGGSGSVFTTRDGAMVADIQQAKTVPPHWATYVAVDKLEAAKQRTEQLGGKILVQEIQVAEVGRFAVTQDSQGAVLCLFEPAAS